MSVREGKNEKEKMRERHGEDFCGHRIFAKIRKKHK